MDINCNVKNNEYQGLFYVMQGPLIMNEFEQWVERGCSFKSYVKIFVRFFDSKLEINERRLTTAPQHHSRLDSTNPNNDS
jgi:hypothetical protein